MREEAGDWSRENAPPPPRPTPSSPPRSSTPPPPASDANASDEASDADDDEEGLPPVDESPMSDREKTEAAAETAAMVVGGIDFVATRFIGQRMALSDREEAKFVKLLTPIVKRRMPEFTARFSEEDRLMLWLSMTYGSKFITPEPVPVPAATPGGGDQRPEGDNSGTPTEAKVDGRKVEATVHKMERKVAT